MIKAAVFGMSALALTAAPVAASAATTVAAPAAKLSLASGARAGAPTGRSDRLGGASVGPIAAAVILAGIAIGAAFLIDDQESSDSN